MGEADLAVNFFVALFALIDPVGNVPLFAAATVGIAEAPRRRLAVYIALFAFGFLTLFYFAGVSVLQYFGISMPAFRIAGGVMLFLLGLDMARGDLANTMGDAAGDATKLSAAAYARLRFERLVVPFAVPLLVGPGAISTAVIYAGEAGRMGLAGEAAGLAVIATVSISILASFWFTGLITRVLGRVGTIIVIRVLGLILCAMAVQFMLAGFADSTVGLMRASASSPYPR